jgi:sec-independent protein translocase protein TatB
MFGLGMEKLFVLSLLGVVLIGPDKLPKVVGDLARFLQKLRGLSQQAMGELKEQLGPEYADLEIKDLDPRAFLAKHVGDIAAEGSLIVESAKEEVDSFTSQARIDPDLL